MRDKRQSKEGEKRWKTRFLRSILELNKFFPNDPCNIKFFFNNLTFMLINTKLSVNLLFNGIKRKEKKLYLLSDGYLLYNVLLILEKFPKQSLSFYIPYECRENEYIGLELADEKV